MLKTAVVVIDFETTGLRPEAGDRITEVAALRLSGDRVVERYATLVNCGVPVPGNITALTGITTSMVSAAPRVGRVMRELTEFIGSDMLVAHSAAFDTRYLVAECTRARVHLPTSKTLCTLRLARRLAPGHGGYRLAAVAERLGVRFAGAAHRAEADAEVTAAVLLEFTRRVLNRYPGDALDPDILRQVTGWPIAQTESRLRALLRR